MTTINAWGSDDPVKESDGGTAQSTYATGDILYASAANTLSKLTIGSANQVLTVATDIPAWATTGGGSASYNKGTVTLTSAQVKALASTPITVVAAQGAGTIIVPQLVSVRSRMGSEVWATGGDIYLVYAGDTTFALNEVINKNILTGDLTDDITTMGGTSGGSYLAASSAENSALQIRSSSNFSGNASNDGTVDVVVWYTVVS